MTLPLRLSCLLLRTHVARTGCHLWISGTLVIFLRGLESNEALRPVVNAIEAALVTPKVGTPALGNPTLQASTDGPVRVNSIVQVVIKVCLFSLPLHSDAIG